MSGARLHGNDNGATLETQEEENGGTIEGTPDPHDYYPGHRMVDTPTRPTSSSAPPANIPSAYDTDSEDPVEKHFALLGATHRRNRTLFEEMKNRIIILSDKEIDALKLVKVAQAETEQVKQEMDSMRHRVEEAVSLEKANAGLGEAILTLKRELADAEAQVSELHEGILTVVSKHSKKARRSL